MMLRAFPLQTAAALALILGCCATARADALVNATLVTPLAPDHKARLTIPMPPRFAADEEVWMVYELVALSPDKEGKGEIGLEQSFEGVMTPAMSMLTAFRADKMDSHQSGGTIAQQMEGIAGRRTPAELQRLMGAELYSAYEAVNAGKGLVLTGRLLRRLPAPGKKDAPLLVSVVRAKGMQPVTLKVTVGQGSLPVEFQEKAQGSWLYKLGYALGLVFFGWLVMRFFRRR